MKHHVEFDLEFLKNPYKGLYIALEGIDGAGKTTQVEDLGAYFRQKGKEVVLVREPRKKGVVGDLVQKVLHGDVKMPSKALQYLFSTDRIMHHEEVIVPSLKEGKVVISDRCFWSAIVYGILDRIKNGYKEKDVDFLLISQSILSFYHQFIVPDFTFYLKIDLQTALKRLKRKDEKIEIYEDEEKLKTVIKGYEWLSKRFKDQITVIDGAKSKEEVTKSMMSKIKKL